MMVVKCSICGRVKPCNWIEDPNTGDGDFVCEDSDATCVPEETADGDWWGDW